MQVNILGQNYHVVVKKYADDEAFAKNSIDGYCDWYTKDIVVCDMNTWPGWEHETKATVRVSMKQTLRQEIVHAFLYESGLADSSFAGAGPWAKNEEMVDWIALQGPKIYKVWEDAGAL